MVEISSNAISMEHARLTVCISIISSSYADYVVILATHSDRQILVITGDVFTRELQYGEATVLLSTHQIPVLLLINNWRHSSR